MQEGVTVRMHSHRIQCCDVQLLTKLLHCIFQVTQGFSLRIIIHNYTCTIMCVHGGGAYVLVVKGHVMVPGDWIDGDVVEGVQVVLGGGRILQGRSVCTN